MKRGKSHTVLKKEHELILNSIHSILRSSFPCNHFTKFEARRERESKKKNKTRPYSKTRLKHRPPNPKEKRENWGLVRWRNEMCYVSGKEEICFEERILEDHRPSLLSPRVLAIADIRLRGMRSMSRSIMWRWRRLSHGGHGLNIFSWHGRSMRSATMFCGQGLLAL